MKPNKYVLCLLSKNAKQFKNKNKYYIKIKQNCIYKYWTNYYVQNTSNLTMAFLVQDIVQWHLKQYYINKLFNLISFKDVSHFYNNIIYNTILNIEYCVHKCNSYKNRIQRQNMVQQLCSFTIFSQIIPRYNMLTKAVYELGIVWFLYNHTHLPEKCDVT